MIDDKMNDNVYCMWMIILMILFIVCVEIIMIHDKMIDNIYCMLMIRFIV
jgi:hypothetical protein